MSRKEVLNSIKTNADDKNLVKHMLTTEAIWQALARRLGENEKRGLACPLHDIDIELTRGDMTTHSKLETLRTQELGVSETVVQDVLHHNETHDIPLETKL